MHQKARYDISMVTTVTIPNLITLGRLFLVPIIVWLILTDHNIWAFWIFIISGISDAVDGIIARRFGLVSTLGAYLDPLADKVLLVSIYIALGYTGTLPAWIIIMVVSRDILIIGGIILTWMLDHPIQIKPRFISKVNTTAQIMLAAIVLARSSFFVPLDLIEAFMIISVVISTAASAIVYVMDWLHHMTILSEKNNGRNNDES